MIAPMEKILQGIKKRLICLCLDILAIPSLFLSKKKNAIYHLKHICPKCPKWRREMRDVACDGKCWWNANWKKENYGIHRHFGIKNVITQYLFLETNLRKYRKKLKKQASKKH